MGDGPRAPGRRMQGPRKGCSTHSTPGLRESRAHAGQGQQKGTGSSSFGDRGVTAAQHPGSVIFRTGNRCCLVRKHLRSIRAPCACPGRNLVGTGGTGWIPPGLAPAGLGGIALRTQCPHGKAPAFGGKGMGRARAVKSERCCRPPLHRGCSILRLQLQLPRPAGSGRSHRVEPLLQHPPSAFTTWFSFSLSYSDLIGN